MASTEQSVIALMEALEAAGAVIRLLGSRLGTVTAVGGERFEVDATLENSPSVLFDALVLPDGAEAVEALAKDGHTLEFLKDQYRHCKTILALGQPRCCCKGLAFPLSCPGARRTREC